MAIEAVSGLKTRFVTVEGENMQAWVNPVMGLLEEAYENAKKKSFLGDRVLSNSTRFHLLLPESGDDSLMAAITVKGNRAYGVGVAREYRGKSPDLDLRSRRETYASSFLAQVMSTPGYFITVATDAVPMYRLAASIGLDLVQDMDEISKLLQSTPGFREDDAISTGLVYNADLAVRLNLADLNLSCMRHSLSAHGPEYMQYVFKTKG